MSINNLTTRRPNWQKVSNYDKTASMIIALENA